MYKLSFKRFVFQHIEKNLGQIAYTTIVGISAIIFTKQAVDRRNHIAVTKRGIGIEHHKMEFTIVDPASEALDVITVCQPVATTYVALGSHIVAILVNVHQVAYLLPYLFVGGVGCQLLAQCKPLPKSIPCTTLLFISDATVKLELVDLVGIYAVPAIAIMLVVVLADVEHTQILSIKENVTRLPSLAVEIEPRGEEYTVYCSIIDTCVCIVATITNL